MRPSKLVVAAGARQRGASLVVSLVMLAVLMIIGVAAYVGSTTQFKMAGNLQFQNVAMSNAESALAQAENWIIANSGDSGFTNRVSGGLYPVGTGPDPFTMTWDDTTSVKVDALGTYRYIIEVLAPDRVLPSNSVVSCNIYGMSGPCPSVNVYRITTRGTSILGTTKFVQSVFTIRIIAS